MNNKIDIVYTSLENIIQDRNDLLQLFNSKINERVNNIVKIWITDAKRPGGGGRLNADTCGQGAEEGVKNWQNLADIFYV